MSQHVYDIQTKLAKQLSVFRASIFPVKYWLISKCLLVFRYLGTKYSINKDNGNDRIGIR